MASWFFYTGIIAAPCLAVLAAVRLGTPDWVAVSIALMATVGVVLVCQRLWPYCLEWRDWGRVAAVDLVHSVVSTVVAVQLFLVVVFAVVVQFSMSATELFGGSLWPSSWPLVAQLVLALVIGELGFYWIHRLGHTIGVFWRFHALHHSSERLYALAAGRTHPVNAIAVYAGQVLPLIALGIPPETLLIFGVFTGAHGLLQHANVHFRFGALNWIFSTPDLHRWHHSVDIDESGSNYGSTLILWDVVFGTRFLPADRQITRVGLPEIAFTRNYWRHIASPFELERLRIEPDEVEAEVLG
jgi:sterol desaturase/sphingolipid hydroxylase (fatty acid hydroxylase superfamily)